MTHVRTRLVICCIAILLSLAAHDATAAELTLTPVVAEVLQPDLMPFPEGTTPDLYSLHGIPVTLKVDYFVEIANLQEGQLGFGNVVFNVDRFRLQQNALIPDWQPDVSFVDVNGPALGGVVPTWDDNADIGQSRMDLRFVYAGLFPRNFLDPEFDPRYRIAQDRPAYIGSTYIDWDGARPAMLQPQFTKLDGFSIFGEDRMLRREAGLKSIGDIQLGIAADHQNMRVLDWDQVTREDELFPVQSLRTKNVVVDVSFTGDLMFPSNDMHGHPNVLAGYVHVPVDFANSDQTLTAVLDFSRVVTDVEFNLYGVNCFDCSEVCGPFADQITVRGFLGNIVVAPDLTNFGEILVEGNVLTGTQTYGLQDAIVHFGQPIDRIELVFGNVRGAEFNPGRQDFGISDVHFTINNPEPGSIALAIIGCGVLAGRRYWKSRAART